MPLLPWLYRSIRHMEGCQWAFHSQEWSTVDQEHSWSKMVHSMIIFECVHSTYDECLSPSFLWSLFSSPFAPLHLFCHFLNTPFPFLERFLKVLGSIMEDRPKWSIIPDSLGLVLYKQQMFRVLIMVNSTSNYNKA